MLKYTYLNTTGHNIQFRRLLLHMWPLQPLLEPLLCEFATFAGLAVASCISLRFAHPNLRNRLLSFLFECLAVNFPAWILKPFHDLGPTGCILWKWQTAEATAHRTSFAPLRLRFGSSFAFSPPQSPSSPSSPPPPPPPLPFCACFAGCRRLAQGFGCQSTAFSSVFSNAFWFPVKGFPFLFLLYNELFFFPDFVKSKDVRSISLVYVQSMPPTPWCPQKTARHPTSSVPVPWAHIIYYWTVRCRRNISQSACLPTLGNCLGNFISSRKF